MPTTESYSVWKYREGLCFNASWIHSQLFNLGRPHWKVESWPHLLASQATTATCCTAAAPSNPGQGHQDNEDCNHDDGNCPACSQPPSQNVFLLPFPFQGHFWLKRHSVPTENSREVRPGDYSCMVSLSRPNRCIALSTNSGFRSYRSDDVQLCSHIRAHCSQNV